MILDTKSRRGEKFADGAIAKQFIALPGQTIQLTNELPPQTLSSQLTRKYNNNSPGRLQDTSQLVEYTLNQNV